MTPQKDTATRAPLPLEPRRPRGEQGDNDQEEIRLDHSHELHRDGREQRFDLSRAAHHHAARTWILGKPRVCS